MSLLFNRTLFFQEIKKSLFKRFRQEQVDGLNMLLRVWERYYSNMDHHLLAYLLAASYFETATTMQPIYEYGGRNYFKKYDWQSRLGNTQPGDGYRFRGAGHVQNTGRRNARVSSEKLNKKFGLNLDLEAHPEMRIDPFVSAHCLFLGTIEGWWTGRPLTKYINDHKKDYFNARSTINGDKYHKFRGYSKNNGTRIKETAEKFEKALEVSMINKE